MKYVCCFLMAGIVGLPGIASAQEITLFGGFHHPGAMTLSPAAGGVSDAASQLLTDPKDFGVFGARFYHPNAPVGLEHSAAFSPHFIESDARAFIYHTNLRAELPAPVFRPYATAGIGLVHVSGDGAVSFGTKFSFNYGGGLKASLFGPAGVRLDVRGYAIRGVQDQTLKVLETTVGIFFSF
jgi:hypothetical protein